MKEWATDEIPEKWTLLLISLRKLSSVVENPLDNSTYKT